MWAISCSHSLYISDHLPDILAIDIKKANLTANIGDQYSKSISGSVVCFDNSIAYTTANVKSFLIKNTTYKA